MNDKLKEFLTRHYLKAARALVENPEGLKYKFSKISEKLSKNQIKDSLGDYIDDFKTLLRMVKAWSKGDYRDVSKGTITYVILCLIYFLTPTDFVPDFIMGLGLIDDIAVLRWTLKRINEDVKKFSTWEIKDV